METLLCPYCGEMLDSYVDPGGEEHQTYVEDCAVCCRPILFRADWDEEERAYRVSVGRES